MEGLALFSTPVFRYDVEDQALLRALAEEALAESQAVPSLRASNGGATWHGPPDLARRTSGPWRSALEVILPRVRETLDTLADTQGLQTAGRRFDLGFQMWAMVARRGGYNTVHEHHGAGFSVALYADAGDDPSESGGVIAFVDPRRVPSLLAGLPLYPSTFAVRPKTGMLLVFPGWLQHFVHPYQGERPRVTLSANVMFQG
jgi:uncharacterized protein (TIGR02466 family)